MTFKTKKDLLYSILFYSSFILLIIVFYQTIVDKTWYMTIILLILNTFLAWIWFGTKYKIEDTNLYIQMGPWKRIIPIHQINNVRLAKNPLSSAALAMERIEINYGNYKTIQISPQDRDAFIEQLHRIKPTIDVMK